MTASARAAAPAAALLLLVLTACGGAGSGTQEELVDDGVEGQPDDPIAAEDCLIGDWLLDVEELARQSGDYLVGLSIPITDYAMDGGGILTFGADGAMAVNIDVTTTGVLHGDDVAVPITVPSHYNASGTWSRPDADVDAIDIENATEETSSGDESLPLPLFDFESNPHAFVVCDGDFLSVQGEGSPFGTVWTRTG
jgi:hypothetical protein